MFVCFQKNQSEDSNTEQENLASQLQHQHVTSPEDARPTREPTRESTREVKDDRSIVDSVDEVVG